MSNGTVSTKWIWQQEGWPDFHWRDEVVLPALRNARLNLGKLLGKCGYSDDRKTTPKNGP